MKPNETLAFCGIYCGGCKNYKENANCMGCRYEETLVDDCPTRSCAMAKGLLHCGECGDFPCPTLKEFYEDGMRHHAVALRNIQRIMEVGHEEWLREQEQQHTCQCGRRKLWFAERCTHEADD